MKPKFKNYQRVMVLDFTLNGVKGNVGGMVESFDLHNKEYKVIINSVIVYLPEDRLVNYEEYFTSKGDT